MSHVFKQKLYKLQKFVSICCRRLSLVLLKMGHYIDVKLDCEIYDDTLSR